MTCWLGLQCQAWQGRLIPFSGLHLGGGGSLQRLWRRRQLPSLIVPRSACSFGSVEVTGSLVRMASSGRLKSEQPLALSSKCRAPPGATDRGHRRHRASSDCHGKADGSPPGAKRGSIQRPEHWRTRCPSVPMPIGTAQFRRSIAPIDSTQLTNWALRCEVLGCTADAAWVCALCRPEGQAVTARQTMVQFWRALRALQLALVLGTLAAALHPARAASDCESVMFST